MGAQAINTSTRTCTCMGTKSITITDEAYAYLKSIKGDRSFSEVIVSLSRSSDDIMGFAGALKGADLQSIRDVSKEVRRDWNRRR